MARFSQHTGEKIPLDAGFQSREMDSVPARSDLWSKSAFHQRLRQFVIIGARQVVIVCVIGITRAMKAQEMLEFGDIEVDKALMFRRRYHHRDIAFLALVFSQPTNRNHPIFSAPCSHTSSSRVSQTRRRC